MKKILVMLAVAVLFVGCSKEDGPTGVDETVKVIRINEVNGNGEKFVELYNTSDAEVDISGMSIVKNEDKTWVTLPASTKIAAKGFVVIQAEGRTVAGSVAEGRSGVSMNQGLLLVLRDKFGSPVDEFRRGFAPWGVSDSYENYGKVKSFARQPDGVGSWKVLVNSSPIATNDGIDVSEETISNDRL